MELHVDGDVWYWRGPAPFHFVTVGAEVAALLRDAAGAISYGWGMVPVEVRLGGTRWTTSLWPKDGGYVVPLKDAVRRAEDVKVGERVHLELHLDL